jgi:hypothetical protein
MKPKNERLIPFYPIFALLALGVILLVCSQTFVW